MKVLQINTSVNIGSTGRIAEDIGKLLQSENHQSIIAYGRNAHNSNSDLIKVGKRSDLLFHLLLTRLLDQHGFGSRIATEKFVKKIERVRPDIIHFHTIHGYFLNIDVLITNIEKLKIPVVWTFHDCWPFTGHCSYFDSVSCYKWQSECNKCPNLNGYPKSWFLDNSRNNFYRKRALFTNLKNLTIITPSYWLANHVQNSFLKDFQIKVIHNGVDLNVFKYRGDNEAIREKYKISNKKFILGVANIWDERKGLLDFIRLREKLTNEIEIVLVGLKNDQINRIPDGIVGIKQTRNAEELARIYSSASIFLNPTYVDNFPTTNIEALACGTPAITYNTGGSPEAIDGNTGFIVEQGDIEGIIFAIQEILNKGEENYRYNCRQRAEKLFDKNSRFKEYIKLYKDII